MKELKHFVTGGIAHGLAMLEGSLATASRAQVPIGIVSDYHKPFGLQVASKIFSLSSAYLGQHATWIRDEFEEGSLQTNRGPRGDVRYSWKTPEQNIGLSKSPSSFSRLSPDDVFWTVGRPLPRPRRFKLLFSALDWSPEVSEGVVSLIQEVTNEPPKYGVHVRATDRQSDLLRITHAIRSAISRNGTGRIFVSSDSPEAAAFVTKEFSSMEVLSLPKPTSKSGRNLHYGVGAKHAWPQFVSAVADIFVLSQTSFFVPSIGSGSGWTSLIRVIRAKHDSLELYSSIENELQWCVRSS